MPSYNICPYCGNTIEIPDATTHMLCSFCSAQLYLFPPGSPYTGQIIPPGQEHLYYQQQAPPQYEQAQPPQDQAPKVVQLKSKTDTGRLDIGPVSTNTQSIDGSGTKTNLKLTVTPEMTNIKIASPVGVDLMSGLLEEISSSKKEVEEVLSNTSMIKLQDDAMDAGNTDNVEEARVEAERIRQEALRQAEEFRLKAEAEAKAIQDAARREMEELKAQNALKETEERVKNLQEQEARLRELAELKKQQNEILEEYEKEIRKKLQEQMQSTATFSLENKDLPPEESQKKSPAESTRKQIPEEEKEAIIARARQKAIEKAKKEAIERAKSKKIEEIKSQTKTKLQAAKKTKTETSKTDTKKNISESVKTDTDSLTTDTAKQKKKLKGIRFKSKKRKFTMKSKKSGQTGDNPAVSKDTENTDSKDDPSKGGK